MIISDTWAYVHIPRTGGKTLKQAYIAAGYSADNVDCFSQITGVPQAALHMREHTKFSYWDNLVGDRSVFTIVRNPYDRITSLWRRYKDIAHTLPDAYNLNVNTSITFSRLLQEPATGWSLSTTQKEFIASESKSVTVYKFETDLAQAYADHGLTLIDAINAAQDTENILDDAANLALVNDIFDEDFTEFGYEKR
jgi:hypothetical protein